MEEVPVLVVGGGGAGLSSSMLLSGLGVEHLLVSSQPTTSTLPKAHVLNQRALEILDDCGAYGEIRRRSTPPEQMAATAWYSGLTGDHPDDGRLLARLETWGAGGDDESWRSASAFGQLNLPQIRLEPVLKERAEELAPGSIRFGHELTALEQDEEGVTATILDREAGSEYQVRAGYLVAADGGRTVPELVGIGYEGFDRLAITYSVYVSADLSGLTGGEEDVLLRWVAAPRTGASFVLSPMGPDNWGPKSEEWAIHIIFLPDDPRMPGEDAVEAMVRESLGIEDLEMEVHRVTRWEVGAVLAERFREGRVFLVGDAAHRHPPTGGLGLNSAFHDAHNLCWKLAAVLGGQAGPALLDTYEEERKPVDARNVQRSMENALGQLMIFNATGLSPEQDEEANRAALARLWSGREEDAEARSAFLAAVRAQSQEFSEHNVEYGYAYESAAVVPDGTPPAESADDMRVHAPSTRPGSPLPHAWVDDEDGNRRPIKDLVAPGRFLLIAGEDGQPWVEAAQELAAAGQPVDALRIGHVEGDLFDARSLWARHRGISREGAVLVRPDRFVAWRSAGAAEDPAGELGSALDAVLAGA
ncbi:MAG: FAD-dependent monooxygenase [Solirubrobacterales bacterium]